MSDQTTSEATPSATSSPALADGVMHCDSPAGPMTDLFGQEVVHASPSAPQESSVQRMTRDTYGRRSSDSSASAALQSLLASRLPGLLDSRGSMVFSLTWKQQVTPLRRRICALLASARRTSGRDCIGWPTPMAGSPATETYNAAGNTDYSRRVVELASWPTPNAGHQNDGDTTWQQRREAMKAKHGNGNGFGLNLGQAATLATWATPTTRDWKDGATTLENTPVNCLLGRQVLGCWSTPQATDAKCRSSNESMAKRRLESGRQMGIEAEAHLAAGTTLSGSSAATEKRGQLNPAFSRWLMGYPPEWDDCAVTAMQSFPKSRQRSSRQ